jgi:serine/threonine-protein kinase RsbT
VQVADSNSLDLRTEPDIVKARQLVRQFAQTCGFSLVDQTKVVTAASELARNTVKHGGGGVITVDELRDGTRRGVRVNFEDQGPGIADLSLAMTDGWTSGGGLGLGLTGSKRLSNEFEIESTPGSGTRVTIVRWK